MASKKKKTTWKSIKGRGELLGRNLKQIFRTKRFNGKIYGFSTSWLTRNAAGKAAAYRHLAGNTEVKITQEGDQFIVWERFVGRKKKEDITSTYHLKDEPKAEKVTTGVPNSITGRSRQLIPHRAPRITPKRPKLRR